MRLSTEDRAAYDAESAEIRTRKEVCAAANDAAGAKRCRQEGTRLYKRYCLKQLPPEPEPDGFDELWEAEGTGLDEAMYVIARKFYYAGHLHRPLDKTERYTIPLYPAPPDIDAVKREVKEKCAEACEKIADERFEEYGITESDTGASYYSGRTGDEYEARDEEDHNCAAAIRAMEVGETPDTSDTPRTDAAYDITAPGQMFTLACTLERELAEMMRQRDDNWRNTTENALQLVAADAQKGTICKAKQSGSILSQLAALISRCRSPRANTN
jgi:hypothetical protein